MFKAITATERSLQFGNSNNLISYNLIDSTFTAKLAVSSYSDKIIAIINEYQSRSLNVPRNLALYYISVYYNIYFFNKDLMQAIIKRDKALIKLEQFPFNGLSKNYYKCMLRHIRHLTGVNIHG